MYKAFIPIFISSLCVFAGCTHNGMPTDKAMIAHFTENEVAFVKLQHLIGEKKPQVTGRTRGEILGNH